MKVQQSVQTASLPHSPSHGLAPHLPLPAGRKEHTEEAKFRRASSYGRPRPLPEIKEAHGGTQVKTEEEKDVRHIVKIE